MNVYCKHWVDHEKTPDCFSQTVQPSAENCMALFTMQGWHFNDVYPDEDLCQTHAMRMCCGQFELNHPHIVTCPKYGVKHDS